MVFIRDMYVHFADLETATINNLLIASVAAI